VYGFYAVGIRNDSNGKEIYEKPKRVRMPLVIYLMAFFLSLFPVLGFVGLLVLNIWLTKTICKGIETDEVRGKKYFVISRLWNSFPPVKE
jgi:hypothetical protein